MQKMSDPMTTTTSEICWSVINITIFVTLRMPSPIVTFIQEVMTHHIKRSKQNVVERGIYLCHYFFRLLLYLWRIHYLLMKMCWNLLTRYFVIKKRNELHEGRLMFPLISKGMGFTWIGISFNLTLTGCLHFSCINVCSRCRTSDVITFRLTFTACLRLCSVIDRSRCRTSIVLTSRLTFVDCLCLYSVIDRSRYRIFIVMTAFIWTYVVGGTFWFCIFSSVFLRIAFGRFWHVIGAFPSPVVVVGIGNRWGIVCRCGGHDSFLWGMRRDSIWGRIMKGLGKRKGRYRLLLRRPWQFFCGRRYDLMWGRIQSKINSRGWRVSRKGNEGMIRWPEAVGKPEEDGCNVILQWRRRCDCHGNGAVIGGCKRTGGTSLRKIVLYSRLVECLPTNELFNLILMKIFFYSSSIMHAWIVNYRTNLAGFLCRNLISVVSILSYLVF